MENYLNLFEHIPEDEHNHISNKIWEALDRAGIELSQDAELSIRIYDDEYEGDNRCIGVKDQCYTPCSDTATSLYNTNLYNRIFAHRY